ncbi:MAG: hypothetical protein QOD33_317, partial [Pyrinomonadaceae bacterium]|nr:hypothetical protein [Pyrinomonadaceae bacterium]
MRRILAAFVLALTIFSCAPAVKPIHLTTPTAQ